MFTRALLPPAHYRQAYALSHWRGRGPRRLIAPALLAGSLLLRPAAPVLADGEVRVKPGDTLTSISRAYYGDSTHAQAIASYNHLTNPGKVFAGQVLRLPGAGGGHVEKPAGESGAETVRVRPGDTLTALSLAYYGDATHASTIADANRLRDPSHIEAGQKLVLPPDTAEKKPIPMAQSGVATWYGPGFEGKTTKCGQVYHQAGLSAASNDLPCGAVVEVTNADNGRSVVVPVTDTGAFRHPDILDLSRGAFASLASTVIGVIPIHLKVHSLPAPLRASH